MNLTCEDYNISSADFIPWIQLKDKTFMVTGATGLIGSALIKALLHANKDHGLNLRVLALVRDKDRAEKRFSDHINDSHLKFIVGSVEKFPEIQERIDFIIHGASKTASKEFVEHAVETIETSTQGTRNLLDLARDKKVEGFVYLSSMEMYGYPQKGHKVTEDEAGILSPLDIRNSYPISKLMCEAMCVAHASEYKIPAKIARLTQTFGPGVNNTDNRIFAYFAKCISNKQNIVLKTKGETERSYLHVLDAVTAILMILLKGDDGQAYNVADESTYCSIAEMAMKIAAGSDISVEYDIQDEADNGFPKTIYMDLDTSRIKGLGWKPLYTQTS